VAWLLVTIAASRDGVAQTLLNRLEQRLNEVLPADAPPPAARLPVRGAEPRVRPAAAFLVERPTIGARVGPVTEDARREYGLTTKRGALVAEVSPGGSVEKAGITLGAVIVAVDGRRIDSPQDLSELVRGLRVGQEIELTYYETEQLRRKRVRVGTSDGAPAAEAAEPLPPTRGVATPERGVANPERGVAAPERGPALKRLERVIEGFAKPPVPAPDSPEADTPLVAADDDLRAEVAELRAELVIVRRRLAELERRLESRKPRPGDLDADDPDDDRPKLNEADRPQPAGEPKLRLGEPKLEAPANDAPPKPKADSP